MKNEVQNIKNGLKSLEMKPIELRLNIESVVVCPHMKLLTFVGEASWTVFKTKFIVVSATNGAIP